MNSIIKAYLLNEIQWSQKVNNVIYSPEYSSIRNTGSCYLLSWLISILTHLCPLLSKKRDKRANWDGLLWQLMGQFIAWKGICRPWDFTVPTDLSCPLSGNNTTVLPPKILNFSVHQRPSSISWPSHYPICSIFSLPAHVLRSLWCFLFPFFTLMLTLWCSSGRLMTLSRESWPKLRN
jgi:hypothetical protein